MSSRTSKTIEELREASFHVSYEWMMFQECVQRLTYSGYQNTDPKLYNALLTAFGVHSRNVLDFFYPPSNAKLDDIIANDYFEDPLYWSKIRPEPTEHFKKSREMVNKLNTHLTYMRATWKEEDRWWLWTQTLTELGKVWNVFIVNVSPEKLYHD